MNINIKRPPLFYCIVLGSIGALSSSFSQSTSPRSDRDLLVAADITSIRTLSQNWTDAQASEYYNTPQGSQLIPYTWFLNLEQAGSTRPFREPEHFRALGYLPRAADVNNPDGLPIGFVKDGDNIGMTCAACHTGQINFHKTAWLIDGGPTRGDGETMLRRLEAALRATQSDSEKFARFARAILGSDQRIEAREALKNELTRVTEKRASYNARNLPRSTEPPFGPGRIDAFGAILNEIAVRFAQVPTNPTTVDAPVSYPFLWDTPQHDKVQWNGSAANTEIGDWRASIFHTKDVGALGRNIGEVMGVFAEVETTKNPGLVGGYASSVRVADLIKLEDLLRQLWSPQWPDEFGKIDGELKAQGEILYNQNCISCHQPINRTDESRKIIANLSDVGTDQTMARNVANRSGKSGVFNGRRFILPLLKEVQPEERLADLLSHVGQRALLGQLWKWDSVPTSSSFSATKPSLPAEQPMDIGAPMDYSVNLVVRLPNGKLTGTFSDLKFDRSGKLISAVARSATKTYIVPPSGATKELNTNSDIQGLEPGLRSQVSKRLIITDRGPAPTKTLTLKHGMFGLSHTPYAYPYKARPLNGVWATAPFLHNGSVPNLDELLKEASARQKTFRIGSAEFDPVLVGYRTDLGESVFDTTASPGNSNAGHDKLGGAYTKVFTADERRQLIEYIKSL